MTNISRFLRGKSLNHLLVFNIEGSTSLVQILDQFDSKVVFTATFVLYKIIVKFAIMKIY